MAAAAGKCAVGVSDSGKSTAASILEAAAIAVAGYNTAAAIYYATKQYDIAKDYLDIAKWWRNYYNSTYKPWEDQELAEAWALAREKPFYDITVGRTRNYGNLEFKGMAEKSMQCTSAYCTGLRAALLKDVVNAHSMALGALSNMGFRNERAYVDARDDVRWKRRENVLNRGRDMIAENIQFSNLAAGIYGDLAAQAGQAASGAIGYLGYSFNKNETQFPTLMRGVVPRKADMVTASGAPPAGDAPVTEAGTSGGWVSRPGTNEIYKPEA